MEIKSVCMIGVGSLTILAAKTRELNGRRTYLGDFKNQVGCRKICSSLDHPSPNTLRAVDRKIMLPNIGKRPAPWRRGLRHPA
ncbi:hypothetical protein ANN_04535 [Periplaneta americana]|uniref:Uncharacterized protein n=1 Tax=Periplaneta americana TaxID=6978 RepID=A0ABQ8TAU1_PERAM|nr:hypothetical protein ANN_04535 [Periplaneta americana]